MRGSIMSIEGNTSGYESYYSVDVNGDDARDSGAQVTFQLDGVVAVESSFYNPGSFPASLNLTMPSMRGDVVINEFFPGVSGWIEVYNNGTYAVNLKDWVLDDGPGGLSPYTIPYSAPLPSRGFAFFYANETSIVLPDAGTVRVVNPNGNETDRINYNSTDLNPSWTSFPPGVSAGRYPDGNFSFVALWPTPGERNSLVPLVRLGLFSGWNLFSVPLQF
ncbi:Lamin Tail Domain protein [uncultured archaeon]|nr:Lamin Tail Domain protein [uncultured archaeon]